MRRIIAIAGAKHSGKSEAAKAIRKAEISLNNLQRFSFANPMKEGLLAMGVPWESLYGEEKNVPIPQFGGATGRDLMVTLATEWGRYLVHPDLWVLHMAHKVENFNPSIEVLIDDLRFQNEYDWLRSQDAIIIGIERGELPGRMEDQHISEQMPYRFAELGIPTIKNDGTIAELHAKVIALLTPPT